MFMQEMIELNKQQQEEMPETPAKLVTFLDASGREVKIVAGPAQFGKLIEDGYTVRKFIWFSSEAIGCQP